MTCLTLKQPIQPIRCSVVVTPLPFASTFRRKDPSRPQPSTHPFVHYDRGNVHALCPLLLQHRRHDWLTLFAVGNENIEIRGVIWGIVLY